MAYCDDCKHDHRYAACLYTTLTLRTGLREVCRCRARPNRKPWQRYRDELIAGGATRSGYRSKKARPEDVTRIFDDNGASITIVFNKEFNEYNITSSASFLTRFKGHRRTEQAYAQLMRLLSDNDIVSDVRPYPQFHVWRELIGDIKGLFA